MEYNMEYFIGKKMSGFLLVGQKLWRGEILPPRDIFVIFPRSKLQKPNLQRRRKHHIANPDNIPLLPAWKGTIYDWFWYSVPIQNRSL